MNAEGPAQAPKVRVHVNIEIAADALQALVANAKQAADNGPQEHRRVDTADKLGEMITRFLDAHDFTAFVADIDHYR